MIGLPEILILVVLFLVVTGPAAAALVIWKYLIKPNKGRPGDPPTART